MNTREFIEKFQQADVNNLALQADKYPDVDMPFALDQIEGRQTALLKIPTYSKKNSSSLPSPSFHGAVLLRTHSSL